MKYKGKIEDAKDLTTKEYVDAKEIKNKNGLLHYECPKCGGRLNKGNILK